MKDLVARVVGFVFMWSASLALGLPGVLLVSVPVLALWSELQWRGRAEIDQLRNDLSQGEGFDPINSATQYVEGLRNYSQALIWQASLTATFTFVLATAVALILSFRARNTFVHPVEVPGPPTRVGSLIDLSFDKGNWYGLVRFRRSSGACSWVPLSLLSVRRRSHLFGSFGEAFRLGLLGGVALSLIVSAAGLFVATWVLPATFSVFGKSAVEQAAAKLSSNEQARELRISSMQIIDMQDYPGLLYAIVFFVSGLFAVISVYPFRKRRFGTVALDYLEDGRRSLLGNFGTLTNDGEKEWALRWESPLFSLGEGHSIPVEDARPCRPSEPPPPVLTD